jgi:hypothetical protein
LHEVCHVPAKPVFIDKSGVFHTAMQTLPCAETMRDAREKGALRDAISPLHRFRAQHWHSLHPDGCGDLTERFRCGDAICRNTRLSSVAVRNMLSSTLADDGERRRFV